MLPQEHAGAERAQLLHDTVGALERARMEFSNAHAPACAHTLLSQMVFSKTVL